MVQQDVEMEFETQVSVRAGSVAGGRALLLFNSFKRYANATTLDARILLLSCIFFIHIFHFPFQLVVCISKEWELVAHSVLMSAALLPKHRLTRQSLCAFTRRCTRHSSFTFTQMEPPE